MTEQSDLPAKDTLLLVNDTAVTSVPSLEGGSPGQVSFPSDGPSASPQRTGKTPPGSASPSWSIERHLLHRLLGLAGHPAIHIILWDGQIVATRTEPPVARLVIRNRRALWALVCQPDYHLLEGYMRGVLEIDGGLVEFMREINRSWRTRWTQTHALRRWWQGRSIRRARRNVSHHYDLGNDFYRLWLDQQLLYTCAYFPTPEVSLEEAQVAKMDLVCRKLQLRPGESVIEAGCGWGALALHMAREYGVQVRAYNISHEQILYARNRARTEGLGNQVEFIEDDWRNIAGRCDAFVSVGMLEHVGPENCQRLGEIIHRSLSKTGRGLIHSIGMNFAQRFNRWIEQRIFPGAQPPSLKQMLDVFEPYDFSVLDVENLRPHYALTLRHWLERFERSVNTIRSLYGEEFVRMWRMYLASSESAFEAGGLQLFQVVFARSTGHGLPWTREHLYQALSRPASPGTAGLA